MAEATEGQDQIQQTPIYDQMVKEFTDPPTEPRIRLPDICCQPLPETSYSGTPAGRLFRSALVGQP